MQQSKQFFASSVLCRLGLWFAAIILSHAAPGDADGLSANIGGSPSIVYATAIQPDGKIIIGGAFSSVLGVGRNNIARLNSDGSLDTTFNPKTNARVDCVAVQTDGKILVGGVFTTLQPNGAASTTTRNYIARLNADGTLDTSFDPRANNEVYCMAIQADGKILLCGNFTSLQPNGATSATTRNYVARLNSDGTLDTGFNPRANNSVYTLALQSNGSVVLGGTFTTLQPNGASSSTTRNRIARVLSSGALDTTFNPNAGGIVYCTALEPDGQILLGGAFTTLQPNGASSATTRNRVARLNNDGTLDVTFNPNAGSELYGFAVQSDGKVLLAGDFTTLQPNGAASATIRNKIARVNADGTLDTTFNPNANSDVSGMMLQNDGSILVVGSFGAIGGVSRGDFARLTNDASGSSLSAVNTTQIQWMRNGTAPEVTQVSFDISTSGGSSWTSLGTATRIGSSSSWQMTGLTLPALGHIRARGRVSGGFYQGSSGIVEEISLFGPKLDVSGNGIIIANGDTTPQIADGTDLGDATMGSPITRTFTLTNTGISPLIFNPSGATFSGPDAADFSVAPSSNVVSIAVGSSTSFQVVFSPSAPGLRTAIMTFATNDPSVPLYSCSIQGTGWATSNADLSALSVSPGSLNSPFNPSTLSYGMSLPFWEDEIAVTPVKAGPEGTIEVRVNGGTWQPLSSGVASPSLGLPIFGGTNIVNVRVTSADATTIKTYTINILRGPTQSHYVDPADWGASGAGLLRAIAYDSANGSTLIGGSFSALGGWPRSNLARIQTATGGGSMDAAFNPSPNGWVHAVAVQTDGKILVAGQFTEISPDNGVSSPVPRNSLARLHPDGTLDTAFHPFSSNTGQVNALAIQPDGKILIAGSFSSIHPAGGSSSSQQNLARLHPDGTVDLSFDPQPDSSVTSMALQSDGKIILGGIFQNLQPNGAPVATARTRLARVNADGSLDTTFSPSAGSSVAAIAIEADGRILVGGAFVSLQGTGEPTATTRNRIARLNSDGTVDATFDPKANDQVSTIAVMANRRILIGGQFTTLQPNGAASPVTQNRIAMVNFDGTQVSGFAPNPDNTVLGICLQEDGRIQICGGFTSLHPTDYPTSSSRSKWAMLYGGLNSSSYAAIVKNPLVAINHTQADWQIYPFSPEITSAYLEHTDGITVTPLGSGVRVGTSGFWRFTGVNFPNTGTLRAWGFTSGGEAGGSVGRIRSVSSLSGVAVPEISVLGNTVSITSGDVTPSSADHTDFGPVLTGASLQRSFTISNLGGATLNLSDLPINLSGSGAAAFAATTQPISPIPAGGSTVFTVSFTPLTAGSYDATITFGSNDFDEGSYTFSIHGTGATDLTPNVSPASTNEDTQTVAGLVLTRNLTDSLGAATHFKITDIMGGALYQNDGITPIATNAFLSFPEVNAGLKFTPALDFNGSAGFNVQASTTNSDVGLRDGVVPVSITVSPVNDVPSFVIGSDHTHATGTATTQEFADGATGISDGDSGVAQTLVFHVANDNASIFTTPPSIAADGMLSYTPNGTAGTAVVSVSLTDDATAGGAALTTAVQTFTIKVLSAAEIAVSGNSANIGSGDATPDSADHTDFGALNIADAPVVRTFMIANSGETNLDLTASPLVQIIGPHASDFTVTAQPVSPVAPADSSNFTISFDSSAAGLRSATVIIANSDVDEAPFEFAIQGMGVISTNSELSSVLLPGVSYAPAFIPSITNYTGSVPAGTTSFSLTPSGELHGTIEVRINSGSWTTVASGDTANLPLNPGANTVEVRVTAQNGDVTTYTFIIHSGVLTPSITSASTDEDLQTATGLVLSRNVEDLSGDATHFKISNIANGTLYQNDGITPITSGSFITFSEGNAGLKFTPSLNFNGIASFNVQASTASSDPGLAGSVVTASITVAPVNDPPTFSMGGNRTHSSGSNTSQNFASGATNIDDGDLDVSQSLTFNVTHDNASIFITPPSIAGDGTLSYTPSGTAGTALVSVSLTDDATAGGAALTTAVQTFTIKVLSAAEIAVSGNSSNITNGDASPDPADHTDFGSLNIADAPIVRTFTIANIGETNLALTEVPLVQIIGPHASDFTVTAQPVSPINSADSSIFTISFNSSGAGIRNATVIIANSDDDEATFEFAIQGMGVISTDSSLASISLSDLTFTPTFSSAITSYSGSVSSATTGITISPSASSYALIEVRVNGGAYSTVLSGGVSSTLALNSGANIVEVRVTAQNGETNTYSFTITRTEQAGGIDALNLGITGNYVMATAMQPDGKTLIGGNFTHVLGTPRQHLARINADGTLDTLFNPKPNSNVYCITVQNDGKILIGGNFTNLQPNGAPATTTRNRIARLNVDGTLDTGFDPNASGFISCILPQPDGKILLGGSYGTLKPNGGASTISRPMLARVNADGTLDNDFAPTPNSSVDSIALQPDGKIVLGGVFTTLKPNGAAVATARQFLARINADGSLDNSFAPNPNNRVHCVALQPDGKILLGGTFTAVEPNGIPNSAYSNYIARLNSDGSLDSGFDPNGNTTVNTITLQADGKSLIGGTFTILQPNGGGSPISKNRLARLNVAGTLDTSFDSQADNIVYGLSLQGDGKIYAGGTFTSVQANLGSAATTRNYFARLTNDNAVQTIIQTGSTQLEWMRGDTAPEVSQVLFEQSVNGGTTWTPLGSGTRVGTTANWLISGLSLPATGQVRARGRTAGGYFGGSSGIVQTVATLTATLTDLEIWRQFHFGSIANAGDGANDNDFDNDGVVNLLEYAFGLDPKNATSRTVPSPMIAGGFVTYNFIQPAGTNGLTYQAEWSETMQSQDWHEVPNTGVVPNHEFAIPTAGHSRIFTRLKVISP